MPMNFGQKWQLLWMGPSLLSTGWWREWWNSKVVPWVAFNFRFGKWPSKGFYLLFRYWRIGWIEVRRFEADRNEEYLAGRDFAEAARRKDVQP